MTHSIHILVIFSPLIFSAIFITPFCKTSCCFQRLIISVARIHAILELGLNNKKHVHTVGKQGGLHC